MTPAEAFPDRARVTFLSPAEQKARGLGTIKQWYQLALPFRYVSAAYGVITVPEGTVTDFGSVPKALLSIISADAPWLGFPAIVHDYIYQQAGDVAPLMTRYDADNLLDEAMKVMGASSWQRLAVLAGVRPFGASHWGKKPTA